MLEPPAFSHDMAFFDKGFDPDYNNWAYSVHMYWFTPEMRDFYQYLEPSRRLNVPVWIGEGRGKPEAMAVFYDMVAEYGVGYNLFSWKSMGKVTGEKSGDGILSYPAPEGWEKISEYIEKGGPRPSYEDAQKLLDTWIEASRFENCSMDPDMAPYSLRRQGITLPGPGYDSWGGPGVSFQGTWREGNIYGYRTEDQIKMVRKEGAPIPHIFDRPISGLENLLVDLRPGEFVSYSVNQVVSENSPKLLGQAVEETQCVICCGGQERAVTFPAGEVQVELLPLALGDRASVKILVQSGELLIESVTFPV